ncbi:MAG TPA: HAD hydrolase-like protein [Bryobacteraceae bacterium]|nr:HAD hydrolase-like protein [Bryobacteraceae bacterium]HPT27472.1 HAD hydrolase-like protein [Bryobacteraceae bacterium]
MTGLQLLIDADDTLWENNIYFEAAFADFCEFLGHSSMAPKQVRQILDEIELANSKIHGYGSLNFGRNLQQCYQHLAERHVCDADLERVMGFATRILEQPIALIEGVEETLAKLSARHTLTLFTKGHPDEQRLKIDQSGVAGHFAHTAIVKEKDKGSYMALMNERGLDPARTWMIGNSPKSDINPALEAGLNAVLIPHDRTWGLELQEIRLRGPGEFKLIERFAGLLEVF